LIDLIVGLGAALLIGLGLVIIAGPALPRALRALVALLRHAGDHIEPPKAVSAPEVVIGALHPSSQRALQAATQLSSLLRTHGHGELAAQLRAAGRRLTTDEASGLRGLARLLPRLQRISLTGDDADHRLRILVQELKVMVADRAEQLELLPFR
jgi:hypothetical protein